MGYASRQGRARISCTSPQAAAMCDRCGFIYSHADLRIQKEYAGAGLISKQWLVCRTCEDVPQPQLRAIVIAADPVPIINPRPPDWEAQRTDKRITIGETVTDPITSLQRRTGEIRATEDNNERIVQKNGDEMLKPPFENDARSIDECGVVRDTMDNQRRVTQPRLKVPPPPRRCFTRKVRVTDTGDTRVTLIDDRRVTQLMEEK